MTADEWNEKHPVGTLVMYRSVSMSDHPWETTRTRSAAWTLGHGAVVVKIEGRSGGVSIEPEHMRVATDDAVLELADKLGASCLYAVRAIADSVREAQQANAEAMTGLLYDNQALRGVVKGQRLQLDALVAEAMHLRAMKSDRDSMLAATRLWQEHPPAWDAPCECGACMEYGAGDDCGDEDA